jgi:ABC-type sugar transport system permease subunit
VTPPADILADPPQARPQTRRGRRFTSARQASWPTLAVFLLPGATVYALLIIHPVLLTFYNSLHTIVPPHRETYVGLANFHSLLASDHTFWKAVWNTALFSLAGTLADVAGGLVLALCLFSGVPLARVYRIVWFAPVLMSYVVVGILWVWIYDYDWGLVNVVLRAIGLGAMEHSWLGDPKTALWAVLVTHLWKWLGFNMIICLAALHALPKDELGADDLDNCGWWAKLFYIVVPMLRPTLVNLLILSLIGKMMVFDLVWIMTGGGPLWSTETVSTYVYKRAFDWNTFDLGYPSAIAVLWFAIILAFVIGMNLLLRRRERLEF